MLLFGQGCKGTGFNPISITDGSPTPSDLLSSARAPEADMEADLDDLNEAFDDFDDYADAALVEVVSNFGGTAADIEGEGSDENHNIPQEESDGLFGIMEGGLQADLFKDGTEKMAIEEEIPTEQEQNPTGSGENAERSEKAAEGAVQLVPSVISDSLPRANPHTSGCWRKQKEVTGNWCLIKIFFEFVSLQDVLLSCCWMIRGTKPSCSSFGLQKQLDVVCELTKDK
ncbi:hypothetical protein LINPERHAP1_LOCUS6485, partial [Linum perenne]